LPEVIHAHCGVYAGAVAAEISKAHNLPLVLTEHSSSFARNSYRSWQLRLARRATEGADARIAVSPSLAEVLEENLYSGNRRWIWIPNVVADRFSSETLEEERNGRGVRLLSLGMMLRHKGQIELVRAFARAFGPGDDVELWFGGDGPALAGVKAEAEALALAGRVRFLGRVRPAEVPMLLGSVDALVIASHYETFGVAAAESLMVGKPVLATRSGGPECIVGREDGLLVEPKNVAALAEGLKKLVGNLDGYSASGLAERARARFGAQAVAEKLTRVYRRVQERGDIGDWKP
jgi:teichuronic acid biosynthesis glycosyltransferase TuaC